MKHSSPAPFETTQVEARLLSGTDLGKKLKSSTGSWEIVAVNHDPVGLVNVSAQKLGDIGVIAAFLTLFPDTQVTVESTEGHTEIQPSPGPIQI